MPRTLEPIPEGVQIVDKSGAITTFFRLRWEALIQGFLFTPTVAAVENDTPTVAASVPTTIAYTTLSAGRYRVSYYMRKTVPDGVNSSLTMTIGWTEGGQAQTKSAAALTTDTVLAEQDNTAFLRVDGNTDITFAIAYASNTPGLMKYVYDVSVEQQS